ncbi:MAG: extracellular solute-binding protein [Geminicoccaceae bacterium]
MTRTAMIALAATLAVASVAGAAETATPSHGVAMHGDLAYPPDFTHFAYADPAAPKGGEIVFSAIGSFDSLNPFILRGQAAAGAANVFETLTERSRDEPFAAYGLLAETIEMPEDRSWVAFTLRPEARWHDGQPVTVEDVIFSLETIKTRGHPLYRAYYANVTGAEPAGERRVLFHFDGELNRELPLIIGELPILPKHFWEGRDFEATTLEPLLGSGPYRVARVDPGRSLTLERVADYWGQDLPVNKGRYNFDRMRYEYFRDGNVALEAFKAGQYDIRIENIARLWATGYTGPAIDAGLIVKEEIQDETGDGMQGFVFNTRREIFSDPRVRAALAYAFDFEWSNQTLFYGQYARTKSYFSNTDLAARELPDERELRILEPFRAELPPEVFTTVYEPPVTDGSGELRDNLRTALELLREAGWEIDRSTRKLVNSATGQPMRFEILLVDPAFERIVGPMLRNLERLGIDATMRTVDTAQYQNRLDSFDFDMVVTTWGQSMSPGNEQRDFWSCAAAATPGSRNLAGICDPVVDALVDRVIAAESREDLVAATRALDRVLLAGHYVIPHWHSRIIRVAYWDKLAHPDVLPRFGLDLDAWWVDKGKEQQVAEQKRALTLDAAGR